MRKSALLPFICVSFGYGASAHAGALTWLKGTIEELGKVTMPKTRPLPTSYADVDRGHDYEGGPKVFTPSQRAKKTKILYFHGAGANTSDGIIDRLAPALHAQHVDHEIISLPYDASHAQIEQMIGHKDSRPVIVAAHSMGGGYVVHRLLQEYPKKILAAVLINPAAFVVDQPVPTLLIRGTEDHPPEGEGGTNVTLRLAKGADHSLRYRLKSEGDKMIANESPETAKLVKKTAKKIARFLEENTRGDK